MSTYLRRQYAIEAKQFTYETGEDVCEWVGGEIIRDPIGRPAFIELRNPLKENRPMNRTIGIGQWVMPAKNGGWHILHDDAFHEMFEPADQDEGWMEPGVGYHPNAPGKGASMAVYEMAGGQ